MKIAVLLLALIAVDSPRTTLTYVAARDGKMRTQRIAFEGSNPGADYRPGFENAPPPVRNLPLWLPEESRKPGCVVFDDGEEFTYDKGKETYVLSSLSKWKSYTAVGLHYGYQGMRQNDNWTIEARYDTATGYLLTATVRTRSAEGSRVIYDLTLSRLNS